MKKILSIVAIAFAFCLFNYGDALAAGPKVKVRDRNNITKVKVKGDGYKVKRTVRYTDDGTVTKDKIKYSDRANAEDVIDAVITVEDHTEL